MHFDICEGSVSVGHAASLGQWNGMIHAFLAHSAQTPAYLGRLLAAEPDLAIGHAAKGLFCLMLARREMIQPAREALASAQRAHAGSLRERLWVSALAAWLDGQPSKSIACMEEALRDNPRDTFSAKVSELHSAPL